MVLKTKKTTKKSVFAAMSKSNVVRMDGYDVYIEIYIFILFT